MRYRIGCTGWGYDEWKGSLYPPGAPPEEYLRRYARVFDLAEVDSSYYRAPTRQQAERWARETPDGFLFAPKMPGAITHDAKLRGTEPLVAAFLDALEPLRRAGHNEAVLVVFDPKVVSYDDLLRVFWESHDPTQGMRQGNDVGTQYRSGIYFYDDEQREAAEASRDTFQKELSAAGYGRITTEILPAPEFYYAEDYHQQYLAKNPGGYCGLGGTGVSCPVGVG